MPITPRADLNTNDYCVGTPSLPPTRVNTTLGRALALAVAVAEVVGARGGLRGGLSSNATGGEVGHQRKKASATSQSPARWRPKTQATLTPGAKCNTQRGSREVDVSEGRQAASSDKVERAGIAQRWADGGKRARQARFGVWLVCLCL